MASSKPPPPDPNIGLAAQGQSRVAESAEARAVANDEFFRENFAPRLLEGMDRQNATARELQDFGMGLTRKYDQRFWDTTAKFQDQFYDDVRSFNTEDRREQLAGQAGADIEQASAAAGAQAIRGLQRQGINPNSGAMLMARKQWGQNTALARAAAQTMARDAARREGMSLKGVAAGMGAGVAGMSQGWAGLAGSAGATGLGAMAGAQGAFGANNASWNQTMGVASGALGSLAGIGQSQNNLAAQAAMADANNTNSMIGTGVGAVAMVAAAF